MFLTELFKNADIEFEIISNMSRKFIAVAQWLTVLHGLENV